MMESMRSEYLRVLPERIDLIATLAQKPDWDRCYDEFHKLKGTGQTYGFPDVTILCQRLEDLCRDPQQRREEHLTSALKLLNYLLDCYTRAHPIDLKKQSDARVLWPEEAP